MLTSEFQTAAYIAATVLFILSLGGLSNQESAKRSVWYGIVGMAIFSDPERQRRKARASPTQSPSLLAVVASADLAHTHLQSGPYGYSPAAEPFDLAVGAWAATLEGTWLTDTAAALADDALSCGFTGMVMIQGLIAASQEQEQQQKEQQQQQEQKKEQKEKQQQEQKEGKETKKETKLKKAMKIKVEIKTNSVKSRPNNYKDN